MFIRQLKKSSSVKDPLRRALGLAAVGALALSGVVGTIWAPASHAVPGFPVIDDGKGEPGQIDPNWDMLTTGSGDGRGRYTQDGWVRLLDNNRYTNINMLNKESFSSKSGFIADFDYRMTGAPQYNNRLGDGFTFYFTTAAAEVSNGAAGMGLGYSQGNDYPYTGVKGGVLGIGFDAFGNFSKYLDEDGSEREGLWPGEYPDTIAVRGAGDGGKAFKDYPLITSTDTLATSLSTSPLKGDDPATDETATYRHVRVRVMPAASSEDRPKLDMWISAPAVKDRMYGDLEHVIQAQDLNKEMSPDVNPDLKLGFSAATGLATAYVDLRNVTISSLADLSVYSSLDTDQPADGFTPGTKVTITAVGKNFGPTSLDPGTAGEEATAEMVVDLSALRPEQSSNLGDTLTLRSDGMRGEPQYENGKVFARWWTDVSMDRSVGDPTLRTIFTIPDDVRAGEYHIPTYIANNFTDHTFDKSISYVTPDMSASDPYLENNETVIPIKIAAAPRIELGDGTALLSDGHKFKAGASVEFSFPVTNTGNTDIDKVVPVTDDGGFTGAGTRPELVCTPIKYQESGTCTAQYFLTQEDVDRGSVSWSITATGEAKKVGEAGIEVSAPTEKKTATLQETPDAAVTLTKSVTDPAQGAQLRAGDVLNYNFKVANKGDATLFDVNLKEGAFTGTGSLGAIQCPDGATDALAPDGQFECQAQYTLTQADIDALGVTNTASVQGSYASDKTVEAQDTYKYNLTATKGIDLASEVSTLSNPKPGDTLNYTFTVRNSGDMTLSGWDLNSQKFDGSGQLSDIDCPDAGKAIVPGGQFQCTAAYKITEKDLLKGSVTLDSKAVGHLDNASDVESADKVVSNFDASASITLTKTAQLRQGQAFEAGSIIDYHFVVQNTGAFTLTGAELDESGFGGTGALDISGCQIPASLAWDAQPYQCDASYQLTQADVDNGGVTNLAVVTAHYNEGTQSIAASSEADVVGEAVASIQLTKTVTDLSAEDFVPGAEVSYEFTITNTGAATLKDVLLTDSDFSGSGKLGKISCDSNGDLAPADIRTCHSSYTITQNDVDAQKLVNTALVTGKTVGGLDVTDESTATLAPEGINSAIAITNTARIAGEQALAEGNSAVFDLLITNTGVTTLKNVVVGSYFNSEANVAEPQCDQIPAEFAPGQSFACTVTTTVTAQDVNNGRLVNTSTVTASDKTENDLVSARAEAQIVGAELPLTPPTQPETATPAPEAKQPGHQLPVTGSNLAVSIVALVMLPLGIVMIRRSRRL